MGAFDGLRGDQVSHGYWGPHTGTIDWCESNYSHSPYIAETYNTLTNIPVVLGGLYGALATYSAGVNKRYAACYLGLSLIGIGSTGFHASLRWEWQLMDELPMIYVVSYAALQILDTLPGFKPRFGLWGYLVFIAWCIFVTFSYLYLPNPVYHQLAFGAILLTTTGRNGILIRRLPATHPGRQLITRSMAWGVFTFTAGFAIWNIDNMFCTNLRSWREMLGMWAFLLEGHAYWHLMTGFGAYWIFTASIYLQLAIKVSPDAYTFNGKAWLPIVRPRVPAKSAVVIIDDKSGKVAGTGETLEATMETNGKDSATLDVKREPKGLDGEPKGQ